MNTGILMIFIVGAALEAFQVASLDLSITQSVARPGDNITIVCNIDNYAEDQQYKIVKFVKTADNEISEQTIVVNRNLHPDYENHKRFRLRTTQAFDILQIVLNMNNVQHHDTGNYACVNVGTKDEAFQTLEVYRPLNSLKFHNITYGALIEVRENEFPAIKCTMTDVMPSPTMELFIGDQNLTSSFRIDRTTRVLGLSTPELHYTYDMALRNAAFRPTFMDDGRWLMCLAIPYNPRTKSADRVTYEGALSPFKAVNVTAKLSVLHVPKFLCKNIQRAPLFENRYRVVCRIHYNPDLSQDITVVYSEGRPMTVGHNDHQFMLTEQIIDESEREVVLLIHLVKSRHFTNYTITARNSLGVNSTIITLKQDGYSTTYSSSPTFLLTHASSIFFAFMTILLPLLNL